MTAEDALKLTEETLPEIHDKEYKSIMEGIERAAKAGKKEYLLDKFPSLVVGARLTKEGFRFFVYGDNYIMPMQIYGISWEKEKPKKNILKTVLNFLSWKH